MGTRDKKCKCLDYIWQHLPMKGQGFYRLCRISSSNRLLTDASRKGEVVVTERMDTSKQFQLNGVLAVLFIGSDTSQF